MKINLIVIVSRSSFRLATAKFRLREREKTTNWWKAEDTLKGGFNDEKGVWGRTGMKELLQINIIKTENYFTNLSYARHTFLRGEDENYARWGCCDIIIRPEAKTREEMKNFN